MHDSGASRRGDVNACLVLFLLFEKCEVGVCASLIRLASLHKTHPSCPDLIHGCLARSMLEEAHGIDSTRFHLVANHLDTKKDQHRAASEYRFSWASEAYSVVDARSACGSVQCRLGWPCREEQGSSDRDAVCAVLRRTEPARDRNEPAEPRGQTLPSRRQH